MMFVDLSAPSLKNRKPKIKVQAKSEIKQEVNVENKVRDDSVQQVELPSKTGSPTLGEVLEKRKFVQREDGGNPTEYPRPQRDQEPRVKKAKLMFDRSKSDFHSASANGKDILAEAVRNPSPEKVRDGLAGKIVPKQITIAEHGRARLDHILADSQEADPVLSISGHGIDATKEWEDIDSEEKIGEGANLSVPAGKSVSKDKFITPAEGVLEITETRCE
jgi:hypothetical protein